MSKLISGLIKSSSFSFHLLSLSALVLLHTLFFLPLPPSLSNLIFSESASVVALSSLLSILCACSFPFSSLSGVASRSLRHRRTKESGTTRAGGRDEEEEEATLCLSVLSCLPHHPLKRIASSQWTARDVSSFYTLLHTCKLDPELGNHTLQVFIHPYICSSSAHTYIPFHFRGADVNLTDYRGLTPLKVSRRYGQPEIEEMLEAKGAQLEVQVRGREDKHIQVAKDKQYSSTCFLPASFLQVDSCSPSAGAEESLVPPPWKVRTHSRRDELAVGR